MSITYSGPLSRAWARMKLILFSPFELTKWFVLGFTAWLASLLDSTGSGGNAGSRVSKHLGNHNLEETFSSGADRIGDFLASGLEFALVSTILLGVIILVIVMLWISSRGSFMFLDNVVHNRARVQQPWSRFKDLGNSLFVWRFVYGLICLLLIGPVLVVCVLGIVGLVNSGAPAGLGIMGFMLMATVLFILAVTAGYIDFFLGHCVVPIMYRHELTVTAAWKRFLSLLQENIWAFVLYGLFFVVLNIGLLILIAMAGLMTCCVGWLILAIPYLGTVLLLPFLVTFRGLDLEFLAQFGDDFDLTRSFPDRQPPPEQPPGTSLPQLLEPPS